MTLPRRLLLLAGAGGLARPAFAQAAHTAYTARIDRDITSLDPAFRSGPQDGAVIWAVFQKLIRYKPGITDYELDAASEFKQTSDTIFDFTLKPGQMFTGGFGEMTAEDVKFSFERFIKGPKPSPYKSDWANLDQVDVTGKYAGRIVMKQPTPYLLRIGLLDGSGCIMSKAAVEKAPEKTALEPVGSGRYVVSAFEPRQRLVLSRNPDFGGDRPAWERITLRFIPDPKTAELAFRSDETQFTELSPSTVGALRGDPGTAIRETPGLRFIWISLNVEKKPFDDVRVRQAIYKGLDIDQMLLAGYNGMAPRANALIQPPVPGYWKDAPVIKRDVAGAKALLAAAGVKDLQVKLTYLSQPAYQSMALVAQALLREAGITLVLDPRDSGSYWSSGTGDAGRDLDAVIMRFSAKLDPNFNTQWFTSDQVGVWNWSRWRSPEFDRMNAAASVEMDEAKRADLVIGCQKLMAESSAFIWLTYDVDIFAAKPWLKPAIMPTGSDWQLAQFAAA